MKHFQSYCNYCARKLEDQRCTNESKDEEQKSAVLFSVFALREKMFVHFNEKRANKPRNLAKKQFFKCRI